jgi:hypothetical protein
VLCLSQLVQIEKKLIPLGFLKGGVWASYTYSSCYYTYFYFFMNRT